MVVYQVWSTLSLSSLQSGIEFAGESDPRPRLGTVARCGVSQKSFSRPRILITLDPGQSLVQVIVPHSQSGSAAAPNRRPHKAESL